MATPRSNAAFDQNFVPTIMGVSSADGLTPVPVEVDPTTGAMLVSGGTGGSGGTSNPNGQTTSANSSPVVLASDQSAVKTKGDYLELASLSAGSLNADLVPSTDVSGYKSVSIQLSGTWSGSLTAQVSNDNTNFVTLPTISVANTSNSMSNTMGVNQVAFATLNARYLRIRMTTYTSGTATGTVELFSTSTAYQTMAVIAGQQGTWSVGSNSATGSAVPANAFYMGVNNLATGFLTGMSSAAGLGDAAAGGGTVSMLPTTYNGTNFDRIRSATSAAGTTGTGVPAAGMLGFDGTNYQRVLTGTDGKVYTRVQDGFGNNIAQVTPGDALAAAPTTALGVTNHNLVYNNTNYERQRSAAIGDGVVTTGIAASVPYLINGASGGVDRQRGNWNGTTGDTGAKTASFTGATQTNYNAAGANIVINMGAVSGTTPTLTAQVQGSADGGTTWFNITGAVTPSITASGVYVLTVYPGISAVANASVPMNLPRTWRLNYTIGGTTPSFTITNVQVAYNN